MTTHKWSRVDSSARFQYIRRSLVESIPRVKVHQAFSTILVLTVCAENWCGLFLEDVTNLHFFKSVRSLLGRLCRFLPWTTLSYPSRSWMDRRNSIRLFRNHSYLCPFKVKGFKHFTPSPPKKSELYIFFPSRVYKKNARNFVKVAKTKEIRRVQ